MERLHPFEIGDKVWYGDNLVEVADIWAVRKNKGEYYEYKVKWTALTAWVVEGQLGKATPEEIVAETLKG